MKKGTTLFLTALTAITLSACSTQYKSSGTRSLASLGESHSCGAEHQLEVLGSVWGSDGEGYFKADFKKIEPRAFQQLDVKLKDAMSIAGFVPGVNYYGQDKDFALSYYPNGHEPHVHKNKLEDILYAPGVDLSAQMSSLKSAKLLKLKLTVKGCLTDSHVTEEGAILESNSISTPRIEVVNVVEASVVCAGDNFDCIRSIIEKAENGLDF